MFYLGNIADVINKTLCNNPAHWSPCSCCSNCFESSKCLCHRVLTTVRKQQKVYVKTFLLNAAPTIQNMLSLCWKQCDGPESPSAPCTLRCTSTSAFLRTQRCQIFQAGTSWKSAGLLSAMEQQGSCDLWMNRICHPNSFFLWPSPWLVLFFNSTPLLR